METRRRGEKSSFTASPRRPLPASLPSSLIPSSEATFADTDASYEALKSSCWNGFWMARGGGELKASSALF